MHSIYWEMLCIWLIWWSEPYKIDSIIIFILQRKKKKKSFRDANFPRIKQFISGRNGIPNRYGSNSLVLFIWTYPCISWALWVAELLLLPVSNGVELLTWNSVEVKDYPSPVIQQMNHPNCTKFITKISELVSKQLHGPIKTTNIIILTSSKLYLGILHEKTLIL